ncbi:hypothetical protein [Corynebacterium stationis]|uniref:hypothetical protein n=1 Tax=Corynebacterium stationis TaxID=1705 RepID=UPI00076F7DE3|nr:hypothetical protein [Corynebacterium stationis]AMJ44208.1 hypothetical protein AW169_04265 [Corynebacterium stationis]AQX70668.1 hypothetical protein CA21670_03430 [Corynebacterium stationis]ASJ18357.1 hypothetical protein BA700_04265 [Corynebacterium stationis]
MATSYNEKCFPFDLDKFKGPTPEHTTLDASSITGSTWYHSTILKDWPVKAFDPLMLYSKEVAQRMRESFANEAQFAQWRERQKTKAVHLGTYRAAIENMLRRKSDQPLKNAKYCLFEVRPEEYAVPRSFEIRR